MTMSWQGREAAGAEAEATEGIKTTKENERRSLTVVCPSPHGLPPPLERVLLLAPFANVVPG